MQKRAAKRRVYSYIRFSTPEQEKGDSLRRQREWRDQFVKNNDYELDTSLTLLDKGRSAFKGDHKNKGALGIFLESVENGTVPRGSILLVESIDRLTRLEPMEAMKMVCFDLFRHDITVQTTVAEYPPDSANDGRIYGLIAEIQRAHSESKRKSELITASRDEARRAAQEDGTKLTSRCPAWLKPVKQDGAIEFEIIPEAAKAIKNIFEWKLQGIGLGTITIRLNEGDGWKRPKGWRTSYVKKILHNRALIGDYQPHKKSKTTGKREPAGDLIQGYYPKVLDRDLFFKVQELTKRNKGTGGRKDKCSNIFTNIAKCAYCGGTMHYADKGDPPKGQRYLVCSNGKRNYGCQRYSIRYDETEKLILENCANLKPELILPNPDEQAKQCNQLCQERDGKTAELVDIETQLDNYAARVGMAKSDTIAKRIYDQMENLEQQKAELQESLKDTESRLADAEQAGKSLVSWTSGIKELQEAIAESNAVELRLRLKMHLEEFINRIEIFAHGYKTDADPEKPARATSRKNGKRLEYVPAPPQNADDFLESIEAQASEVDPELWNNDRFRAFVNHIATERKTRKGRFVRIHFKSGAVVDLVPAGSLATGMEMRQDARKRVGWRFTSPRIDRLWRDFKTAYKKK